MATLITISSASINYTSGTTDCQCITAGGYFKASPNASYVSSTGTYHELRATVSDQQLLYLSHTAASPGGVWISYSATPNGAGNQFFRCVDAGDTRLEIRSNGGIVNWQANDVNLSDQRLKTDIHPLESYWDKLKAIQIVTFKYTDQTHDDPNIGVIAQQVESVAPELIDVDGVGEVPEDGIPIKTVYTTDLYHASIRALQEAMVRIEILEAEIQQLKNL